MKSGVHEVLGDVLLERWIGLRRRPGDDAGDRRREGHFLGKVTLEAAVPGTTIFNNRAVAQAQSRAVVAFDRGVLRCKASD